MNDINPTIIPNKLLHPIGRMLDKTILKNANRVVVINEGLREYATSMGANPERTYVVRAGIDVERYDTRIDGSEMREKYGIQEDDALLFFMGWLYNFSGLKEVAKELVKINHEKPNVKLLIVGDGDAFDALKSIKEECHLDNRVILTGKQPYEKIPEFISAADICILPAYNNEIMRDIVPIKMYEYMAVGKPVITTRLPGIMKEFGNNNGVLYVDKPEDVLKRAIELIETESIEKEGKRARAFVKNSDWETITDEFEGVLEQVVETG